MNSDFFYPGEIFNGEKDYLGILEHHTTIRGCNILCIGYNEAEVDEYVAKYNPSKISLLTYWVDHKDAVSKKYNIIIGDITKKTDFLDNEFDAVLTFSVMEHLSDIDAALKELSRIIKKDGHLFIFFGPAWSNAYGHHIYAEPGDKLLDFSVWKMPSHLHLLLNKEEIKKFYISNGYSEAQSDCVLHWFYETQLINRLMFEDYLKAFRSHFTLLTSDIMYNNIDHSTFQKLKQKFPDYSDFTSYGGKFLLKNNLK